MRYYKTAVKCKVAVALCTRVRTTVVFSKLNLKISLLVRTRVQSIAFERQNFDFESAFAMLFESREAQKLPSEIAILLGFFNDFRTTHTIFIIKLQTFGGLIFEVHFAR